MKRVVAACIALALASSSCGGDDGGDLEAFCGLVRSGAGDLSAGPVDAAMFEELVDVAPVDVRPAVEQLRNLAKDFGDIDTSQLDQLFAAAFDVEAQSARQRFDEYASDTCGVDDATRGGEGGALGAADYADALDDFVVSRFPDESWIRKVRYDVVVVDGAPDAVEVTFVFAAGEGEAAKACQTVGVWLYDLQDGTGHVDVVDDELLVAQWAGPGAGCVVG